MASHIGTEGSVTVGGNVVAESLDFSLDTSAVMIENASLASTVMTITPGRKTISGTINCHWDETDSTGQEAMLTALTNGTSVALVLRGEGGASGATIATISAAFLETVSLAVTGGDDVTSRSFTFRGNDVTWSTVP